MADNPQAGVGSAPCDQADLAACHWYVVGFAVGGLPAGWLQVLREGWVAPQSSGSAIGHVLSLVTLGMAFQLLLGAFFFHRVYRQLAHDRQERASNRPWKIILPALAGAIYGWSCVAYLICIPDELTWAFLAYLLLGSTIPSIIYLSLTREEAPLELPECPACSYLLLFASQQRCPECGRAFNLAEIGTSAIEVDVDGSIRPRPGVLDRIAWPVPSEHHWQWLRHGVALTLITLCISTTFNAVAYKLNTSSDEPMWVLLGVSLLVHPAAIVAILYPGIRRQILRWGRKGQGFLLALTTTWIVLLGLAARLPG